MPVKLEEPLVELLANTADFEKITADIMLVVNEIVDIKTTDKNWNIANEDVKRVITEAWTGRVMYDPRNTEFTTKQAMRRANEKYGGNCRTCKNYKGTKAHSKSCTPESKDVMGCEKYYNKHVYYDRKRRGVFD